MVSGRGSRASREPARARGWTSRRWFLLGALTIGGALPGCDGCRSSTRRPESPPAPAGELGIASHYHDRFTGRKTASGDPYRPEAMTAAHRTLPMHTMVRVTRIDRQGRTVAGPIVVRVNDRGPYSKGRIIDLSAAAARKLGMLGDVARVRVEVISLPASGRRRPAD